MEKEISQKDKILFQMLSLLTESFNSNTPTNTQGDK